MGWTPTMVEGVQPHLLTSGKGSSINRVTLKIFPILSPYERHVIYGQFLSICIRFIEKFLQFCRSLRSHKIHQNVTLR